MIEEDEMGHVKTTVASKVVRRLAAVACVALLGVGAAACGDDSVDNPGAPTPGSTPSVTTPAVTPAPQSGGSGF
jgi:hypothetical protein